jgi:hypothetical protein
LDSLTNIAELVLLCEPRFEIALRISEERFGEPLEFAGWHRRANADNLLFTDSSARTISRGSLARLDDQSLNAMGLQTTTARSLIRRGEGYRFDCYPTPGAQLIDSPSDDRGYMYSLYGHGWPALGRQDNLRDNRSW